MTNIYQPTPANLDLAAQAIKDGKLVSFPTDTVYGLGANVYNSSAVANIFKAKERPLFDPLISHIADIDFLKEYVETDDRAVALAKHFWPGPLTFVLKRKDNNPAVDLACAGLPSLAVRMPNHPVALELIRKSGVPIVAPSANRFKTISPTTAQHVRDSLGDKVDMILDGGPPAVLALKLQSSTSPPRTSLFCVPAAWLKKNLKNLPEKKFISPMTTPICPKRRDSCSSITPRGCR